MEALSAGSAQVLNSMQREVEVLTRILEPASSVAETRASIARCLMRLNPEQRDGLARALCGELTDQPEKSADWPEELDLPGPPEPDPLPLDGLPRALREHAVSVAAATQTPSDLGATLALAAVSAAVGGRAIVHVDARGWRELPVIYAAAVLPPATRKSPVYELMTQALREWEAEACARVGPSYRAARDRVDVAAGALDVEKKAAARGKATREEVEAARIALDRAEAEAPILPRLLASDATPEALVRLMAEQGGRLALLAPEADPLGLADGRYSEVPRVDELLRAWSGEAIRVDRIGREPVHVERPALTLGLCLQPAVLDGLRNGQAMRGRGLLGRILWVIPPDGLGSRLTGRDVPALDTAAAERYARVLRALLDSAGVNPAVLRLDRDALDALYSFEGEVERDLANGGRLAGIRDWAGKVAGQSVRLAALLELASRAEVCRPLWDGPIPRAAMEAGVALARGYSTHALIVLGGTWDNKLANLRYVLSRACDLPVGSSLRDLHDATRDRSGLSTMDDLGPLVEELVERGCLRLRRLPSGPKGGRPSFVVELHPSLAVEHLKTPAQNPQYLGSAGCARALPEATGESKGHPAGDVLGGRR